MKTLVHNRLFIVLLVLAAIIAISVLAAGIRDMEFREPDPFYFEWPTESGGSLQQIVTQMEAIPLVQVILFWLFVIIFTFIILLLLNPKYRWRILQAVIRAAIIFIFITWVMKAIARRLAAEVPPATSGGITNPPTVDPNSLPIYSPPSDVPWISYFISLAIVLGIFLIGWWLWNLGRRDRRCRKRSQNVRRYSRYHRHEAIIGTAPIRRRRMAGNLRLHQRSSHDPRS